jgi:RNA polymerase sigma-54 factor
MQKMNLSQSMGLHLKLSPQQIQFIKLLQVPTAELDARIQEELEVNPLLELDDSMRKDEGSSMMEEGKDSMETDEYGQDDSNGDDYDDYSSKASDDVNLDDYLNHDDISGYKMYGDGNGPEEDREMPIATMSSLIDSLSTQLGYLNLDERREAIGMQLIGTIDNDGYIRRELGAIVNDLAFSLNVLTTEKEVEEVLRYVQAFDPPGIAARDLQECLFLQLKRKDQSLPEVEHAIKVVQLCFEEFTKKHYPRIQKRLGIAEEELRDAIQLITRLNPKPGGFATTYARSAQYLTPDFILTERNGKLQVTLNSKNAPELRISRNYADIIDTYHKSNKKDKRTKEDATFVKQKLDAAKWFIDAIKQRQDTLLRTMKAIVQYQHDFFLTGDESKLRPMILKDIAEEIGMDISTVSRVANSKSVQTDFGLFPLKYFFSESISTDTGEDVSSKEVKAILKEIIEAENKKRPLSDDKLEKALKDRGYNIARRTVAKYREQLGIVVARLRKEL